MLKEKDKDLRSKDKDFPRGLQHWRVIHIRLGHPMETSGYRTTGLAFLTDQTDTVSDAQLTAWKQINEERLKQIEATIV